MFKPYWFISFANESGCLGGCMVEGDSAEDALAEATRRGLNPGGNALALPVFQGLIAQMTPYLNRLVGAEELLALGGTRMRDLPKADAEALCYYATEVCEEHNKP